MSLTIDETIPLPTKYGRGEIISFRGLADGKEHIILAFKNWREMPTPRVRVHSECLTGDVFGSLRCDCGPQLDEALKYFNESGGLLIYLRQEGRGIGLNNKLKSYRLQDEGHDTYEANRLLGFPHDLRDFSIAAEMLLALGIRQICLLSNNPLKAQQLEAAGVRVSHRVFTKRHTSEHNKNYLQAKALVGGHDGLSGPE